MGIVFVFVAATIKQFQKVVTKYSMKYLLCQYIIGKQFLQEFELEDTSFPVMPFMNSDGGNEVPVVAEVQVVRPLRRRTNRIVSLPDSAVEVNLNNDQCKRN